MTDQVDAAATPAIAEIRADTPWTWLAAGWRDLWHQPLLSLGYGAVFTVIAGLMVLGLFWIDAVSLSLVLAAGFLLVGPLLAVGLYEKSRRLERQSHVRLGEILVVRTAAPVSLAFIGVILMFILLVWVRLATILFAVFLGTEGFPPLAEFVPTLLFTAHGLGLLVVGSVVGGVLALLVFAISAVSVPLLVERRLDAVTAIATSVRAVLANFGPMLLWGALIVGLMVLGMATLFIGLIIVFPLVGHATWHAQRSLIRA